MLVHTACEALRSGHVLEVRYEGYSRLSRFHDCRFLPKTTIHHESLAS